MKNLRGATRRVLKDKDWNCCTGWLVSRSDHTRYIYLSQQYYKNRRDSKTNVQVGKLLKETLIVNKLIDQQYSLQ
jgi:hypothetical protein